MMGRGGGFWAERTPCAKAERCLRNDGDRSTGSLCRKMGTAAGEAGRVQVSSDLESLPARPNVIQKAMESHEGFEAGELEELLSYNLGPKHQDLRQEGWIRSEAR